MVSCSRRTLEFSELTLGKLTLGRAVLSDCLGVSSENFRENMPKETTIVLCCDLCGDRSQPEHPVIDPARVHPGLIPQLKGSG
jgi:hypothetical protein